MVDFVVVQSLPFVFLLMNVGKSQKLEKLENEKIWK